MKNIYYTFLQLLTLASAQTYNFNFPTNTSRPVAWNISVNPKFILETSLKAGLFHPSPYFENAKDTNIVEGLLLEDSVGLANHWVEEYDWYKHQDEIKANFSHYALTVDGGYGYNRSVPLHFVHERSSRTGAVPLLLIHGWPSTFLEWSQVIKPLALPESLDDKHFHVVAVDIPGFGFSPAPVQPGMGSKQLAIIFDNLMQELGYSRYGIASTDLGWWVGMWMGALVPDSLIGHFMDFASIPPLNTDLERLLYQTQFLFSNTRTIAACNGQAMGDTPVGFASFILYLLNKANGGYAYTYDQIITRALTMLIPEPWSNMRLYKDTFSADSNNFTLTAVPSGFTRWSWAGGSAPDIANVHLVPNSWMKRYINLVYVSTFDKGGHFPAETRPLDWVKEVQIVLYQS